MWQRASVWMLLALVAVGSSGCCCFHHLGLDAPFWGGCMDDGCGSGGECGSGGCGLGHCGWSEWGCGKVYWGDYVNSPPRCNEPCDSCGNWVGPNGSYGRPPQAYYGNTAPPRMSYAANRPMPQEPMVQEEEAYYEAKQTAPRPRSSQTRPQANRLPPGSRSVVR